LVLLHFTAAAAAAAFTEIIITPFTQVVLVVLVEVVRDLRTPEVITSIPVSLLTMVLVELQIQAVAVAELAVVGPGLKTRLEMAALE
jgi:hypothetical protein